MTTIRDLHRHLLDQLTRELVSKGFTFQSRQRDYYLDTPTVRRILHISFIDHEQDFDLTVHIGIQHKAFIDLLNKLAPTLSKQEKLLIASIGGELGNLSQGRPRRWTVSSEADIPAVRDSIIAAIAAVAVPYWERFASVEEVLAVTSGDDEGSWAHSPHDDIRAKTAITAAFLIGNRVAFEQLVKYKTDLLRSRHDVDFQSLIDLIDILSSNWPD